VSGMTDTLAAAIGPRVGHRPSRRRGPQCDTGPAVRLRLGGEDLAKIRVRPGGGQLLEAILGLRLLRLPQPKGLGAAWAREARTVLEPANLPLPALSLVELLVDLHAVALQAPPLRVGLQELTTGRMEPLPPATDPRLVWVDDAAPSVQSWFRALRARDQGAVDAVARLFLIYYQQAVDPYWRTIRSRLEAERSRCGQLVTEGGLDRLLGTLHPGLRWRSPMLEVRGEVDGAPPSLGPSALEGSTEGEPVIVLRGRSLVIVPSVLCLDQPRLLLSRRDPAAPVVVVYPALRSIDDATSLWGPGGPAGRSSSGLAKLLGRTQAAVLAAIADTCTTTDLAHRVGISPPTASHHAGILRGAGLVASRRTGNTVVHRLTPLGAELLARDAPPTRIDGR
jgi:DNA-binding transcriptional ArsR family regulator